MYTNYTCSRCMYTIIIILLLIIISKLSTFTRLYFLSKFSPFVFCYIQWCLLGWSGGKGLGNFLENCVSNNHTLIQLVFCENIMVM